MTPSRSLLRVRTAILAATSLAIACLALTATAPAAQANIAGTNVVISEVYGGGGNSGATFTHDFIELYNPTGAAVSLAGWSVQYRSTSGNTAQLTNLTGSIAAGGHYLVQEATQAAVGAPLPTPNVTGAIAMAAGSGQVILANDTVAVTAVGNFATAPPRPANVVDMVGYGTAASFETQNTGTALTSSTSAQRAANGADTDQNNPDFTEATPVPQNGSVGPTPLSLVDPPDQSSEVGETITGPTLTVNGGVSPYTFAVTAGASPPGITLGSGTGTFGGVPTTDGTYNFSVTVTDSAGSPASDTKAIQWTITPAPTTTTPIADIQGTGATTPLDGQSVIAEGEVTAVYATRGLNGFFIQTPGADTANASDAIFVFAGSSFSPYPAIGDSVRVTGTAGEFGGQTQISQTNVSGIADLPGSVTPKTSVPGAACALPGTGCDTLATLAADREAMEGELIQPTAPWTVTDAYDFSPFWPGVAAGGGHFGEIGLAANSTQPLVAPTEVIDAQASAAITARTNYNNAHRLILDDGSSLNYTTAANTGTSFPWLTAGHAVRVGAEVTFPAPVVFTARNTDWRLIPTTPVTGAPTGTQPQIEQTRDDFDQGPADVGGDVKLATFNVLNFFPTTGVEYVAAGGGNGCSYFNDRAGAPVTTNQCGNPNLSSGNGPRGAANETNLTRQRDKIVAAINTANADVVSLEELENSVKFGKPRDFAIDALVTALNADVGAGTWAAVPSPSPANLPPTADQDVIRSGFIYKPANVALVGGSVVLADESGPGGNFEDAREPLAQAFKKAGTPDSEAFAVIVNHFKSKGSGTPDPDGQGNADDRRELQAQSLVTFADEFKTLRGITRVFLAGDFNAYSHEDPIDILNGAGYTNLESTIDPEEKSYNFDGQIGSLDHVLANGPALADVADVDVWQINSYESVYYEYSRFNYNITQLYAANPFRSSDHNPEVIGIDVADAPTTAEIQILGTNDFHGRIQNDAASASAGAGVLAGAVKQLRVANPNTVFAAAGDLIGASTFESFIAKDKPTIDALNEAGLDVSSVGNHEFDQGYDDLVNRVMADYDAEDNPYGGAEWKYLGANVKFRDSGDPALDGTWIKEMDGVQVGFVGAVTEHLNELVSPGGISEIEVTDIVDATNDAADALVAEGADVVVLLVHEGAPNTNCTTMDDDPTSDFGSIVTGVNENVDAIVSGHTHLEYNCSFPVAEWAGDADHPVKDRPVVSSGQYGIALNKLVFTVDKATGTVESVTQNVLKLKTCTPVAPQTACGAPPATPWTNNYPTDGPTQAIVNAAVAQAEVLGAVPLGQIAGPFKRGVVAAGTENRGAESNLGNLVAEVQRWATSSPTTGSAEIAFMNPGGLRADMVGSGAGSAKTVSFKQAATVQPFANTLVNMTLNGAQIKQALEQQWQPTGSSRPFLKLGISEGFKYTYDPQAPAGSRIGTMWLNGVPVTPAATFSVTVNSFLATGGDNFGAFAGGTDKRDTGKTDLQGMVDYLDEFANVAEGDDPLPVDSSQRAVGIHFPAGAPASYHPGQHVVFDVSSWSMSNGTDVKDTAVRVLRNGALIGTVSLDNTVAATPFDETGKATVDVVVPGGLTDTMTLDLVGANTGTRTSVTVDVDKAPTTLTVADASVEWGKVASLLVTVNGGTRIPTGTIDAFEGSTLVATGRLNSAGRAQMKVPAKALLPGVHTLRFVYSGDSFYDTSDANAQLDGGQGRPDGHGRQPVLPVRLEPDGTGHHHRWRSRAHPGRRRDDLPGWHRARHGAGDQPGRRRAARHEGTPGGQPQPDGQLLG